MKRKHNVFTTFRVFTMVMLINLGACSPAPSQSVNKAEDTKKKSELKTIPYKVKKGDTLGVIARRYKTTPGLIMKTNRRKNDRIRAGETLEICPGPFTLQVDKSDRKLRLGKGKETIVQYPIAVGRNDSTPVGKFKVRTKVVNPDWTNPKTKEVIKFGDPRHRIGTRWIGFAAGYGIHGTNNPRSIGTAASKGCIRMFNKDVEDLFDLVSLGMGVIIKE